MRGIASFKPTFQEFRFNIYASVHVLKGEDPQC